MSTRYVTYRLFTENVGTVEAIYTGNYPDSLTGGVEITSDDPELKEYPNLIAIPRIKLDTKDIYYDYVSTNSLELRVEELKKENESLKEEGNRLNEELGNLLIQNAQDKATIMGLEETMGNLLLEVASLKGGAA